MSANSAIEVMYCDFGLVAPQGILEGAFDLTWHDPFNDTGAFSFKIPADDPKAAFVNGNNQYNLAASPMIQLWREGVKLFTGILDNPVRHVGSPTGPSGEFWQCNGRTLDTWLEFGRVYPQGYSGAGNYADTYGNFSAGATPGAYLKPLFDAWNGRYSGAIAYDFTLTKDSALVNWTSSPAFDVAVGSTMLDVVNQLRGLGTIFTFDQDPVTAVITVHAYQTKGTDKTATVILRQGIHFRDTVEQAIPWPEVRTRILVRGQSTSGASYYDVASQNSAFDEAYVGRREGFISGTWLPGSTQAAGNTEIAHTKLLTTSITIPVDHDSVAGSFEPYTDYDKGDTIGLDLPGTYLTIPLFHGMTGTSDLVKLQVAAVSGKHRPGGGYDVELDLVSVKKDPLLKIADLILGR